MYVIFQVTFDTGIILYTKLLIGIYFVTCIFFDLGTFGDFCLLWPTISLHALLGPFVIFGIFSA